LAPHVQSYRVEGTFATQGVFRGNTGTGASGSSASLRTSPGSSPCGAIGAGPEDFWWLPAATTARYVRMRVRSASGNALDTQGRVRRRARTSVF
jgi:hypothetical protein